MGAENPCDIGKILCGSKSHRFSIFCGRVYPQISWCPVVVIQFVLIAIARESTFDPQFIAWRYQSCHSDRFPTMSKFLRHLDHVFVHVCFECQFITCWQINWNINWSVPADGSLNNWNWWNNLNFLKTLPMPWSFFIQEDRLYWQQLSHSSKGEIIPSLRQIHAF